MALTISLTVAATERASIIDKKSLSWTTGINGRPDQINFTILSEDPTDAFVPNTDDEVIFTVDAVVKFKGDVVKVVQSLKSKEFREIKIQAIDHSWEANKGEPIAEIFEDISVATIISNVLAINPELSAFTDNNVVGTDIINYFFIDHQRFTNVLQRLTQQVGNNYYIDTDRDIHFYPPGHANELAPFDLEDDNQTFIRDSLTLSEDGDQIINFFVVEGSLYDASETDSENFTASASQTEFDLANFFSGVSVTVDVVAKTIGTFGLDDPSAFDALYDYTGKKVVFTVALSGGEAVVVTGTPQLPVLIQVDEPTSISTFGILSKKVKNLSLKTLDAAKEFGQAQLARFADEAFSGRFRTHKLTLRAGQRIRINSTVLGINKLFDIVSTNTKFFSEDRFITSVTIASAEQIDAIGILARLIAEKDRSISAADVLNIYKLLREDITLAESVLQDQNLHQQADDLTLAEDTDHEEDKVMEWVHATYVPYTLPAMDFDGSNDFVDATTIDVTSWTKISISFWMQPDTLSGVDRMFSLRFSGSDDIRVFLDGSKNLIFALDDTTVDQVSFLLNDTDHKDKWNHICAVFDATNLTLYINGVAVVTDTGAFNFAGADGLVSISCTAGAGGSCYNGELSQVAIWDDGLTAAEVLEIFDGHGFVDLTSDLKNYVSSANLQAFWRLQESTSSTGGILDSSSNARHGTSFSGGTETALPVADFADNRRQFLHDWTDDFHA